MDCFGSSSFPASIRKLAGLKLFTSIDRFKIMTIPFFVLAANLPTEVAPEFGTS
jgi:hypothetical protein